MIHSMLTRKYNTGFLLIELLITLFLLTTAAGVFAHCYWHIVACHYDAQRHQNAIAAVSEFLETTSLSECAQSGSHSVDEITLRWKKKKNFSSGFVIDHHIISVPLYSVLEVTATWHTASGASCTFVCTKGGYDA